MLSDSCGNFVRVVLIFIETVVSLYLGEVAVALDEVVERGRFHEEGVVAVEDAADALLVRADEDGRLLALHVAPHLLVRLDLRVLHVQYRQ